MEKYLLFFADFDEHESGCYEFDSLVGLYNHFDDKEFTDNLLLLGCHIGEWDSFHLIEINVNLTCVNK